MAKQTATPTARQNHSMPSPSLVSVSLKLSEDTISRIDNIKAMTGETNRTRVMAIGVKVLERLLSEVTQEESSVIIKKRDGTEHIIDFTFL